MAAISFKRLVQEDDDEDDLQNDEGTSSGSRGRIVFLNEEEHPPKPPRRKSKLLPRCCSFNSWQSWVIVILALAGLTAAIVLSMLLTLILTEPVIPEPQRIPQYGAVASDSSFCSRMGGKALEAGGSAVDAAIVTMLCVGTVHPESSGIGGGGFMTIFDPSTNNVETINFRETAPQDSTFDMFKGQPHLSKTGGLAVAVPGELAGMKMAHDMYGRLPWADLFEPVIDLAKNGFPMSEHTATSAATQSEPTIVNSPRFREWFYHENGTLKTTGDIVKRPHFAGVLEKIASNGIEEFYNGTIAEEIIAEIENNSGIMTLEDLALYKPLLQTPVRIQYEDAMLYSPPLPSGGPQMLFIINVMENMNLDPSSRERDVTYQHLVEAFKFSFAARSRLGDPYCDDCDRETLLNFQEEILSEAYAAFINSSISNTQTFPPKYYNGSYFTNDEGTTHISILDTSGMAVAVTTTVNTYFGSKLITSNGIVLNNEMDDFSAPNITNAYGLLPYKSNFISPGKRPLSSTCPTIALKNDKDDRPYAHLIVGGSGGTHIGTSVAQVALRAMTFLEPISEAIDQPRLHNQLYPDVVLYEDGYPDNILTYLTQLGHKIESISKLAVIQGVFQYENGTVQAHSDLRKDDNSKSYLYTES